MKHLKNFNLITESKIVDKQFEFGDHLMEIISKDNPIIFDIDDVMYEISDILGHDVVPCYSLLVYKNGQKLVIGFDIHQKSWWDYLGMVEEDYGDLKSDLKYAQKLLNKIRKGRFTDIRLEVNYQYTNPSNDFKPIDIDEKLSIAIKQVIKQLTNIGCDVENMADDSKHFQVIKAIFPIKLSLPNEINILDGIPEDLIKDFKQFISDYKIDDEGVNRLNNLLRKSKFKK